MERIPDVHPLLLKNVRDLVLVQSVKPTRHIATAQLVGTRFFLTYIFLCPLLEIQVALPRQDIEAAGVARPSGVCSIFVCPNNDMA